MSWRMIAELSSEGIVVVRVSSFTECDMLERSKATTLKHGHGTVSSRALRSGDYCLVMRGRSTVLLLRGLIFAASSASRMMRPVSNLAQRSLLESGQTVFISHRKSSPRLIR
nr:hypothetical protein CFP56_09820 [Quercus suber]